MSNPDAPARSVQLSAEQVESISRAQAFVAKMATIDHEALWKISTDLLAVLDPQPSSDGLASLKAKIEALPLAFTIHHHRLDGEVEHRKLLDRSAVLALLDSPTADGGTT